jgi:hypothetical protein
MSGHTENWGIAIESQRITVLICSRCATPYSGPPLPFFLPRGSSLTVVFPCCPDEGGQYIEWDVAVEQNA